MEESKFTKDFLISYFASKLANSNIPTYKSISISMEELICLAPKYEINSTVKVARYIYETIVELEHEEKLKT